MGNKMRRGLPAVLLALALLAQPAGAKTVTDYQRDLRERDIRDAEAAQAYLEARPDEYVNFYDREERPEGHILSLPLYFGGTDEQHTLRALVKTDCGTNMHAESDSERVDVKLRRVKSGEQYDYLLMTLTADEDYDSEADEEFRITLTGGGNKLYLDGILEYRREDLLADGLEYNASRDPFFKFRFEIEDPATVRYDADVELEFEGDYGEDSVDLQLETQEEDDRTVYRFLGRPTFEDTVRVSLPGARGDRVYSIQYGREYPVKATYSDGKLHFRTDYLMDYAVVRA